MAVEVKERPILFSGPMVRALLAGAKTQTRRVVKPQPPEGVADAGVISSPDPKSDGLWFWLDGLDLDCFPVGEQFRCPYGAPGDVLWVKETWTVHERFSDVARVVYAASQRASWTEMHRDVPVELAVTKYADKPLQDGFRPSIHMPRWACRLRLRITDVRVERLAAITEAGATAEGVFEPSLGDLFVIDHGNPGKLSRENAPPLVLWEFLWKRINGDASWDANPWVWVISFEVLPSE